MQELRGTQESLISDQSLLLQAVVRMLEDQQHLAQDMAHQHSQVMRLLAGLGQQLDALPGQIRAQMEPTEDASLDVGFDEPNSVIPLHQPDETTASRSDVAAYRK
jgi:hypothetical protein